MFNKFIQGIQGAGLAALVAVSGCKAKGEPQRKDYHEQCLLFYDDKVLCLERDSLHQPTIAFGADGCFYTPGNEKGCKRAGQLAPELVQALAVALSAQDELNFQRNRMDYRRRHGQR